MLRPGGMEDLDAAALKARPGERRRHCDVHAFGKAHCSLAHAAGKHHAGRRLSRRQVDRQLELGRRVDRGRGDAVEAGDGARDEAQPMAAFTRCGLQQIEKIRIGQRRAADRPHIGEGERTRAVLR
jgi:hypothetical protein